MNPQTITTEILTPDDYTSAWPKMSEADKKIAFESERVRNRYWFNVSLYGEGTSYEGQGNLKLRVKHSTQPDGYKQEAIWSSPETSIIPTAQEVHAIMCYILGKPIPAEYQNGLPRIAAIIEAMGGLTLLDPATIP